MKRRPPLTRQQMLWLILGILIFRAHGRIIYPDLWAEDAGMAFTHVLKDGLASIFVPYEGYYHLIEKTVTWIIIHTMPTIAWAHVVFFFSLSILVYMCWLITSEDYEWLIPSRSARNWAAVLFTTTPGLNEMAGNMCNLNWMFFSIAALICLRDPKKRITNWQLFYLAIMSLSIGTTVLLLPLYAWRVWHQWQVEANRKGALNALAGFSILALSVVFIYVSVFVYKTEQQYDMSPEKIPSVWNLMKLAPSLIVNPIQKSVTFRPWLGSGLATSLNDFGKWPVVMWVATFLIWWLIIKNSVEKTKRQGAFPLAIFVFSLACLGLLRAIGRPGSLDYPLWITNNYWAWRQSFGLGFASFLFWVFLISPRPDSKKWQRKLFAVFIGLNLMHGTDRIFIRAYGWLVEGYPNIPMWTDRYQPLHQSLRTGCPKEVKVDVRPYPWALYYTSPATKCP